MFGLSGKNTADGSVGHGSLLQAEEASPSRITKPAMWLLAFCIIVPWQAGGRLTNVRHANWQVSAFPRIGRMARKPARLQGKQAVAGTNRARLSYFACGRVSPGCAVAVWAGEYL